ncbi:hypothetical protein V6N12_068378 [Hibiscus sabdariffa]|uniref:Uncharacterized protein n=1 Tax=Hibiscus sabdariffa TaxID=183260 RepID=A0ABR2FQ43_9ROSI
MASDGVEEYVVGLAGQAVPPTKRSTGKVGKIVITQEMNSQGEVTSTDFVALGCGVVSLTFPFPLSLDLAPVNCLHAVVVCMQMLDINKGGKRLLLLFSMHLKVSSTMIRPTLIFRPMMIECNNSIRSYDTVSSCDVGIKLAFKK